MESTVSRLLHSVGARNPTNRTRVYTNVHGCTWHIETLSEIELTQWCPPVTFGCPGMVGRKRMAFAQF